MERVSKEGRQMVTLIGRMEGTFVPLARKRTNERESGRGDLTFYPGNLAGEGKISLKLLKFIFAEPNFAITMENETYLIANVISSQIRVFTEFHLVRDAAALYLLIASFRQLIPGHYRCSHSIWPSDST